MSSQSQTQDASLPLGQGTQISTKAKLDKELEDFNSALIVRNNNEDEDEGIHNVLMALNNRENRLKAINANKKILKNQILAGLGFLHNIGLQAANEKFKGIKVDALKDMLVDKYLMMSPSICNRCEKVYRNYDNDIGAPCFLCEKRLCPDCCPEVNSIALGQSISEDKIQARILA